MLSLKNETPHGRVSNLDLSETEAIDLSNFIGRRVSVAFLSDRARDHAYLS